MNPFFAGSAIIGLTLVVLLNYGWLLALAFMAWSLAAYTAGIYQGAYLRRSVRGGG